MIREKERAILIEGEGPGCKECRGGRAIEQEPDLQDQGGRSGERRETK